MHAHFSIFDVGVELVDSTKGTCPHLCSLIDLQLVCQRLRRFLPWSWLVVNSIVSLGENGEI